ncbi:MAG: threonine--tRNA ligase [Patescibacteria group bacterium]
MNNNLKDHRQIGQELDLFSFHEYAPGAVFWHPKGWLIYRTLEEFLRNRLSSEGYHEISTPVMIKSSLFKRSGHWEHFGNHNMFNLSVWENEEISEIIALTEDKIESQKLKDGKHGPLTVEINYHSEKLDVTVQEVEIDKTRGITGTKGISLPVNYTLKPMNCPEASLIFASKTRSYQDLPIRYSEFDVLHRRELSGVLGGLTRVRQFSIDDAHLFVKPDQIQDEIHKLLLLVVDFYKSLGFSPEFYLSTKPDKAMGDEKLWNEAEEDLKTALNEAKVKFGVKEKDGAFYGPKIDIHIKDSQDRDWQLATIQLDFQIPERMQLEYIDSDGKPKRPVIVHRAILGSIERFIGIITEHFQGAFPLWLSPIQAVILPITDRHLDAANKIKEKLFNEGVRIEVDSRAETLQAKIREATLQKVPYMGIIGDKEVEIDSLSVRTRDGKDLGPMEVSKFLKLIKQEIDKKT